MNRDEAVFLLSHVYDDLLLSVATIVATPSGEFQFETDFRQIFWFF